MHQWFVKRGNIAIKRENNLVILTIDPEGESSCFLTIQDTIEISKILTDHFRSIWQEQPHSDKQQFVVKESESHFSWIINGVKLEIFLNEESNFLQVKVSKQIELELGVFHLSEIAQVLEGFILNTAQTTITDSKKWWQFWK